MLVINMQICACIEQGVGNGVGGCIQREILYVYICFLYILCTISLKGNLPDYVCIVKYV